MKRILNLSFALTLVFALSFIFTTTASAQQKKGAGAAKGTYFIDQNGDGICDNYGTHMGQKAGMSKKGKGYGPQDGTGNQGVGPKDGTGYGAGKGNGSGVCNGTGSGNGSGVCDGTGPKGKTNRGGKN